MIIDTHCHYNMSPLLNDVAGHWKKAQDNGIEAAITVGADLESSKIALEIAKKFPGIYASIGLHPENYTDAIKKLLDGDKYVQEELDKYVDNDLKELSKILGTALENKDKIVAIGEIGLDYYRLKTKGLKRELVEKMQKKAFESQLRLAFKNNLVAIIHVRDQKDRTENNAYSDILDILKKVVESEETQTSHKFVLHCASGSLSYIKEAISLGAYIGIAGNVTYDNAQNLREIVKITPEDKLLIETDAPYLVPKSLQKPKSAGDQICEPYMIKATAEYLQTGMGINLDIITNNTKKLFSAIG